jgi:hypothetical protein
MHNNSRRGPPSKSSCHPHSSANAASGNNVLCFNCGALGHIALNCPHARQTTQMKANIANSIGGPEQNELVCLARTVQIEKAFVARWTINYTNHLNLPRP